MHCVRFPLCGFLLWDSLPHGDLIKWLALPLSVAWIGILLMASVIWHVYLSAINIGSVTYQRKSLTSFWVGTKDQVSYYRSLILYWHLNKLCGWQIWLKIVQCCSLSSVKVKVMHFAKHAYMLSVSYVTGQITSRLWLYQLSVLSKKKTFIQHLHCVHLHDFWGGFFITTTEASS